MNAIFAGLGADMAKRLLALSPLVLNGVQPVARAFGYLMRTWLPSSRGKQQLFLHSIAR